MKKNKNIIILSFLFGALLTSALFVIIFHTNQPELADVLQKLDVNMTKNEVINNVGKPNKKGYWSGSDGEGETFYYYKSGSFDYLKELLDYFTKDDTSINFNAIVAVDFLKSDGKVFKIMAIGEDSNIAEIVKSRK